MKEADCKLCAAAGDRRAVFGSTRFAAVPSLGALAPGHVLLIPKAHTVRMAGIPDDALDEYRLFRQRTIRCLEAAFGMPVHRFEHGSDAAATHTPCTIQHAHLHLIPAAVDVRHRLAVDFDWRRVHGQRLAEAVGDREYLFYEAPSGEVSVADGIRFPSQYLRRVFAEALGVPEWNWREDYRTAVVQETYGRLRTAKMHA